VHGLRAQAADTRETGLRDSFWICLAVAFRRARSSELRSHPRPQFEPGAIEQSNQTANVSRFERRTVPGESSSAIANRATVSRTSDSRQSSRAPRYRATVADGRAGATGTFDF